MMVEGVISESKPKVRKVESDNENSDFKCYDMSYGKPVYVDIGRKLTEGNNPTLALPPNRSEEDKNNNNGDTRDGDGNISLRKSERIFKPPEQLGTVPFF